MQDYDIKRGHWKVLDGDGLRELVKEIFGNARTQGKGVVTSYKAIRKMTVVMKDKATLSVDTQMDPDVSDADASETISRYNDFLFRATGFTSKQRRQRLNKKAKKGDL